MAIDPQTLLDEAKCFMCFGVSQGQALELALLARIASGSSTSGTSNVVGSGSPEGVVTAEPGIFFWDTTGKSLWIKDTGSGNTGWLQLIA